MIAFFPSEAAMFGFSRLAPLHSGDSYVARVVRALGWQRLAVVALVTILVSTRPLLEADVVGFFTSVEIAILWIELFAEMALIAAVLALGYTLLDEALPPRMPLRLVIVCAMLLGLSIVMTVLLYAHYADGFDHLPPPLRLVADSLRWGLPAIVLAVIADMHHRALQTDAAAHAVERSHEQLGRDETEQQLALLQAQIEPHFLFNVLGNVRRLYRTQPQAGAGAIANLMCYLRAALPQLRSEHARLGDELELVRAYLGLFQVRMGARLSFSIQTDQALHGIEFPPMLLITLVENAIKHGLEPNGRGGEVLVRAKRTGQLLEVAVLDDGLGFASAASDGTGVGLANVRRQLAARYGSQARLALESRSPRGACATIVIPLRTLPDVGPGRLETASA
ncbi:histidine kinase [Variovorax sp. J22P240]|uniref:sensor histidine kinase n=1 Tax=Variovorax sp. J22P240 TaxID=3053514 RepID=UPI002576F2B9|nr:histidine kinase [Variovorax sp. J22P240]MDM0001923.1 histidine kinase [Variovorax sp. J22P240]